MPQTKRKRAATLVGAVTFGLLFAATAWAQEAPPAAPIEVKPVTPAADKFTDEDAALFRKVVTNLRTGFPLQIESELKMTVQSEGLSVVINETLKMTAKIPGKMRADLLLKPPALTSELPIRFQVVSDGQKTLVYRPGTKQYSVRTVSKKEDAAPEFFESGLFFGLLGAENTKSLFNLELMKLGGSQITAATEKLGTVEVRVIRVDNEAEGLHVGFFVDPATAKIVQMDLNVNDKGDKILIVERMTKIVPASLPLAANTFIIAPPAGAKRVPRLAVSDF